MDNPVRKDMHLVIVALLDDSFLEDVTLGLTSIGGGQVIMMDAVTGTQNLSQAIPMFAEFVGMSGKKFCKVLFASVEEEEPVTALLEELDGAGIDFSGRGLGEIYAVKLGEALVLEHLEFDL